MTQDDDFLFGQWRTRIASMIREHPLQIISWEATRRCNLSCVHCGSPSEGVDLADELSEDEVVGAFDQIAADFDMSGFRHINITGGEPFVRRDLLNILRRINRHPHYRNIDIQTNGLALADNPDLLDEIAPLGVTGLGISIDGLEATHDAFRRREGAYRKSWDAAKAAVRKGYTVTVSVVAHAKNVDEIPELFRVVQTDIRPRVFRVMTIDPIGRAALDQQYLLSAEQTRQVLEFLRNEYGRNCADYSDPATTMVELGCGGWLGRELEGMVRPFVFHCIAGLNNLGILYDGKLASCSNISRDFIQGDLRRDRIKDIWENRYQEYRNHAQRKTGICADCQDWDYCHGGCMHKRQRGILSPDCLARQCGLLAEL